MRARAPSTVRVSDRDAGGSEVPTVDRPIHDRVARRRPHLADGEPTMQSAGRARTQRRRVSCPLGFAVRSSAHRTRLFTALLSSGQRNGAWPPAPLGRAGCATAARTPTATNDGIGRHRSGNDAHPIWVRSGEEILRAFTAAQRLVLMAEAISAHHRRRQDHRTSALSLPASIMRKTSHKVSGKSHGKRYRKIDTFHQVT
jgi:hypothetical protein